MYNVRNSADMENRMKEASLKRGRNQNRILFLDIIRGFALFNMIIYHLLYDIVYIFGKPLSWFSIRQAFIWQQAICFTFIFISGISFKLSKNNRKNTFSLLICALALTIVTLLVIPGQAIIFGIIHFFALALFITILIRPLLDRIPEKIGFGLALILFILFRNLTSGYLGFFSIWQFSLPPIIYQTPFLFFIGLPQPGFSSADYFPLIPWWFLYLAGFYASNWWFNLSDKLEKENNISKNKTYRIYDKLFGYPGRYSLFLYMIHQPVIYGVLLLVY